MKIATITIHQFRSIGELTLNLGDYSLFVGENNAGKSNIIDALRIFYEKGLKYEQGRDFPKFTADDSDSWIDIEFALTDGEYATLKDEYKRPDNGLKVRKFLQTAQKGKDGKKLQGIHGYTSDTEIADEQFYGAKNVQQGKLGDIIYIEDVSRLADHTKMSGPSALRDLIDDIVKKLVGSSESFAQLTEQFDAFASTFKTEKTAEGVSLAQLEQDINDEVGPWDTAFKLNITAPNEGQIVKNLVSHSIEDLALNTEIDAERFGQGFQRHLIFTLIRLAAQYRPAPRQTAKKEFTPQMTLLLFEEPEAFLHPPQQRVLCRSLRTIASQDGNQVLASSHSPYFVSQQVDDIPSIVRLCRTEGKTQAGQISEGRLQEIFAENQQINEMLQGTRYEADAADLLQDMEAVKYCLWLDPDRCGMFFARHVLLVEGPTEYVMLNYLLDAGKIAAPSGGLFVLDCMGTFNIHRFMNLLRPLNVSHAVLFDADGNQPPHDQITQLIDDTKSEYTLKVDAFPNDLESFLGVEKPRLAHRRPQHLMLKLQQDEIGSDKIDALVQKVASLVSAQGDA